jgi:glutathione S-transferase
MKYANRYDGANPDEHRSEAAKLPMPLESRLNAHACLFGDTPMLADVAIFPFVRQFAHADAAAFAALPFPHLQAWLTKWEASSLFNAIMTKYAVWQPGD